MLLGLDLLAAHMVGDFILQWDWIVERKKKYLAITIAHSLMYASPLVLVSLFHTDSPSKRTIFFAAIVIIHVLVDKNDWQLGSKWPLKSFWVDQTLHIVTLALCARLLL